MLLMLEELDGHRASGRITAVAVQASCRSIQGPAGGRQSTRKTTFMKFHLTGEFKKGYIVS